MVLMKNTTEAPMAVMSQVKIVARSASKTGSRSRANYFTGLRTMTALQAMSA